MTGLLPCAPPFPFSGHPDPYTTLKTCRRGRLGDERRDREGAFRAYLRDRPQLGGHLRARNLRDLGGWRHRQGRGGAHQLLRPGRGRGGSGSEGRRARGPLGHRGRPSAQRRDAPVRVDGPGQRHARPRGQKTRCSGLPFARARQTRTRLGIHAGHSRQGDDRRPCEEAAGASDPEGEGRRMERCGDAPGREESVRGGSLGGRQRGLLPRGGRGGRDRAQRGRRRHDRTTRPDLRRSRGPPQGDGGGVPGTGDRGRERHHGRGRTWPRRMCQRGQRQARQVWWDPSCEGDDPHRPCPRDARHARLHGRDLARHLGGGPDLGPRRIRRPRRRDAPGRRSLLGSTLREWPHPSARGACPRGGAEMIRSGAPERWYANSHAKTAHGLIRYGKDEVVCVMDSTLAGKRVADVLPDLGRDAPIVGTLEEALELSPTSVLVGLAPAGGRLPAEWMETLRGAAGAELEIVSGLHQRLAPEFPGKPVWDVREPPEDIPLFSGEGFEVGPKVVLTVGTDSAIGKMTATLEIERAAREAGLRPEFVPTGQTGIIIAGWGLCVDAVVSDFVAGASEQLVLEAAKASPDLILVEGQGSLGHPAYSGVTLGLMHGSCPDCLILCAADPNEKVFRGVPRPSPARVVRLYEEVASLIKPAPVVAVSLNGRGLNEQEARYLITAVADETGLPTADPFRSSAVPILEAILNAPKTRAIGL